MSLNTFYGSLTHWYLLSPSASLNLILNFMTAFPRLGPGILSIYLGGVPPNGSLKINNVVFLYGWDPNQVFAYNNCLSTGVG